MKKKKIYFFIGTTAELIKMAPVIKEFKSSGIDFKLITSGQNEILFDEFEDQIGRIDIHIAFPEKSEKSSVFYFLVWTIRTFFAGMYLLGREFRGLSREKSYFIVHGDTVSSLLGGVIASLYGLKVVHIESGLRSFNFLEPFPEEISRYIVSRLTDVHFCPNEWSMNNLKNVKGVKVNTKQNTLIESYWMATSNKSKDGDFKRIRGKYFVFVVHRQEHVLFKKERIKELMKYILQNADEDLACIFIVHAISLNFLKALQPELPKVIRRNLTLISRLPHSNFMKLIKGSKFLVTDGGSNQEETYYMGKPCLVLRKRTERIEGLGENALVGREDKKLIKSFLKNYNKFERKPVRKNTLKRLPSKIIADYFIK